MRVDALGTSPIVSVLLDSTVSAGCLWEVRPFHYHLCSVALSRWLRGTVSSTNGGGLWVDELAEAICPSLPCRWFPSHRQAMAAHATTGKRKRQAVTNDAVGSEHMATSGWVLAYILHWACKPTCQGKAYALLQGIIRIVCQEIVPVGSSSIVIKDGVLKISEDDGRWDDMMIMLRQIMKSNSTNISGIVAKDLEAPTLAAAALWTLSSGLHRQASNTQPQQGLQMLRDLSNVLVATVASAMDTWARSVATGHDISTATLLQTHLRGKARPRRILPILRHRLAQKRRPRAAVTAWKEDGTNVTMSPEAIMSSTCSRYQQKVQETMQASTTIELLMDASRFGGTDNEILVIYSPTKRIAAYGPPQVGQQKHSPLEKLMGVASPENPGNSRKLPETPGNSRKPPETAATVEIPATLPKASSINVVDCAVSHNQRRATQELSRRQLEHAGGNGA